MLEDRPLERVSDEVGSFLFQELVEQPNRLLQDSAVGGEACRFGPQQRIELGVASFYAPGLARRGILAGPNVKDSEQSVPKMVRVFVVEWQRLVTLERAGQRPVVVVPVLGLGGERGC
jgi:hypothetical protein